MIYADGELILTGHTYREKRLSTSEINDFLSQLQRRGYFSIKTNGKLDATNPLYNFPEFHQVSDGSAHCISVRANRSRDLCIYDLYQEYLVPEMKEILAFLDGYTPKDLSAYRADRLLLYEGISPEQPTEPIPWPDTFPSLDPDPFGIVYIDGKNGSRSLFPAGLFGRDKRGYS